MPDSPCSDGCVDYFDTETVDMKMYIDKFKRKLKKDTSYKGLDGELRTKST